MLFQAVVIFLPISIFFKILSNGGKVHINKLIIRLVPRLPFHDRATFTQPAMHTGIPMVDEKDSFKRKKFVF